MFLSLMLPIFLFSGLAWELKAARSTGEHVVGLLPAALFLLSWCVGSVGGALVALLAQIAIGNRFRARRMSEAIRAA